MAHRIVRPFFMVVVAVALAAGCGTSTHDGAQPIVAETLDLLPYETMEDWVSYADAVVVFEVTGEVEIAPTVEEMEAGEGTIMRTVTVEVRDTLWRRDGAPAVPASFEFVTWGWGFRGDDRRPMGQASGTRLEVGQRFLAPVAPFEAASWAPIGADLTFAWEDGKVAVEGRSQATTAAQSIDGLARAELVSLFEATAPDPLAVRYADLDPAARYQAVANAERAEAAGG